MFCLYYLTPEDSLYGRIYERFKVRDEKLRQARLSRIETKIQIDYLHYSVNKKVQLPVNQDSSDISFCICVK